MELLAFPCSSDLAPHFLDRVERTDCAALVLDKQLDYIKPILKKKGIDKIYSIPERFYGQISSKETQKILKDIKDNSYTRASFPLNDFSGNVTLLLACLAPEVVAIHATSPDSVRVRATSPQGDGAFMPQIRGHQLLPKRNDLILRVQRKIVEKLLEAERLISTAHPCGTGERPGQGLCDNFPYDCEVLSRYVFASRSVRGRVLEVGCGFGYGAYLMAAMGPGLRIFAMDRAPAAIRVARRLWGADPRIVFQTGDASALPFPDNSFDAVVAFEVIEHLSDPERFIQEVRRVLVDGGVFLGSTPNYRLFPYRVNDRSSGTPEELRREGIWPWHVQAFDEASIMNLLANGGFVKRSVGYPTFTKGLSLYAQLRKMPFSLAMDELKHLTWSAADFEVLDTFQPLFSGYSFVFLGELSSMDNCN